MQYILLLCQCDPYMSYLYHVYDMYIILVYVKHIGLTHDIHSISPIANFVLFEFFKFANLILVQVAFNETPITPNLIFNSSNMFSRIFTIPA